MKPYYEDARAGIVIYHGDCREVLPTLRGDSVRLLWTDPPYGHGNMDGHDLQSARIRDSVAGARKASAEPIANDGAETMRVVVDSALELAVPLLKSDCCCCCCCGGGPSPTFAWFADRMDSKGLEFFHAVVWDKRGRGPGMGWRFRRDYEFVMVSHRRGGRLAWRDGMPAESNIQTIRPVIDRQHPNEKPTSLVETFIDLTTEEDDTILDPFMGSGTTLRAAKDLGRRAIGIEIEERYCEIAAKRLAQEVMQFTPLAAIGAEAARIGLPLAPATEQTPEPTEEQTP